MSSRRHEPATDSKGKLSFPVFSVLFFAALALRMLYVGLVEEGQPLLDGANYDRMARTLLAGGGFGTGYRTPLYLLFLATIYGIAGQISRTPVHVAQAVLGAATAAMTAVIGGRLFSRRVGLIAGSGVAVFPILVIYSNVLLSENLFVFLLMLTCLLLVSPWSENRPWTPPTAGFLAGLMTLTRPLGIFFVFLLILFFLNRQGWNRAGGRSVVFTVISFLLVMSPWLARNWRYSDGRLFVDSAGGVNFLMGNNPDASGRYDPRSIETFVKSHADVDDLDLQKEAYAQGLRYVVRNPATFVWRGAKKMGYLFQFNTHDFAFGYSNGYFGRLSPWVVGGTLLALMFSWAAVCLLALPSLLSAAKGGGPVVLLLWVMGYFLLVHFGTFAEPRFHVPFVPILCLFAADAVLNGRWRECGILQRGIVVALGVFLVVAWTAGLTGDWTDLRAVMGPEGHSLGLKYLH